MKREITQREIILIIFVIVFGLLALYYLLWYTPITKERDSYRATTATLEQEITVTKSKVAELTRMEDELNALFAQSTEPATIAKFDNSKPLMRELNAILAQASTFSLSFGAIDNSSDIVRRSVSLTFTAPNYTAAHKILEDISKGSNRCMLDSLSLTFGNGGGVGNMDSTEAGSVNVSATLVYFEYKE